METTHNTEKGDNSQCTKGGGGQIKVQYMIAKKNLIKV